MPRTVRLEWTPPRPYGDVRLSNVPGFYCITSIYAGEPSRLLYIGRSIDGTVKSRLYDHAKDYNQYRGMRISFAPLLPDILTELSDEDVDCIEKALIYAYNPTRNILGKENLGRYFVKHCFIIKNCGHVPYGFTPSLNMMDLVMDPKPIDKKKTTKKTPRAKKKKQLIAPFKIRIIKKKS